MAPIEDDQKEEDETQGLMNSQLEEATGNDDVAGSGAVGELPAELPGTHLADSTGGQEVAKRRPFDPESPDTWSFELQCGPSLLICAYSPAGNFLAYSDASILKIISTSTWKTLSEVLNEGELHVCCFSPCGQFLSFGGRNKKLSTLCTETWKPAAEIQVDGIVYACAYSPDSKVLCVGGGNKLVTAIDTAMWRKVAQFELAGIPMVISFSPKGEFLSFGGGDKAVTIVSTASWEDVKVINLVGWLYKCTWSVDGELLSYGGEDRMMTTVNTSTWDTVEQAPLGGSWPADLSSDVPAAQIRIEAVEIDPLSDGVTVEV